MPSAGVEFASKNVLADPDLREGIKEFTSWPTIPQVITFSSASMLNWIYFFHSGAETGVRGWGICWGLRHHHEHASEWGARETVCRGPGQAALKASAASAAERPHSAINRGNRKRYGIWLKQWQKKCVTVTLFS
eukprot:scaffold390500_cov31-Prasinocladus_malaysianus.AAC.1